MFNIATLPRITRKVPLSIETDGKSEDHSFTATFQILAIDESTPERLADDLAQRTFLDKAIVGLDDIEDNGKPAPFSPALKAAVLNRFDARGALIKTYFEAVKELALGN